MVQNEIKCKVDTIFNHISWLKEVLQGAGEILLRLKKQKLSVTFKDGNQPVSLADLEVNDFLQDNIRSKFGSVRIISEEGEQSFNDLSRGDYWILDPLDGTKGYLNNEQNYGITISFLSDGIILFGAIYKPETAELFFAGHNRGALWQQGLGGKIKKIRVSKTAQFKKAHLLASYDYSNDQAYKKLIDSFPSKKTFISSISIKGALIARGDFDFYFHLRKFIKIWDLIPVAIIIKEAGGVVSDMKGQEIRPLSLQIACEGMVMSNSTIHENMIKHLNENLSSNFSNR